MKVSLKIGEQTVVVRENAVDRVIRYFNPQKANLRFQSRVRSSMLSAMSGGYVGASRSDRSLSGWQTTQGSPDADTLTDLQTLRDRSRWLVRNSPLGAGAVNTTVTNVVGGGLKLQARIDRTFLKLTDEQADAWENLAEREFRLWSKYCDAQRVLCFGGIQELAFRSSLESGDSLVVMPYAVKSRSPYGLSLQIIEADRVSNPDHKQDSRDLAGGIERDKFGAAVAYHIQQQHPGEVYTGGAAAKWERVPAYGAMSGRRQVLHLYKMLRPGQVRGVPFLAPVIKELKQISRYTDAELMAAVISGFLTVFVTSESGDQPLAPMSPTEETGAAVGDSDIKLGNGAVVGLSPGENINTVNPQRPNAQFDPFVLAIVRQIGLCLEIPYEVLIKHFTASYSAARAALLEAWKFFLGRRAWLAESFCQPVYEAWLEEAIALGRIEAPGFFEDPLMREAYCGAEWVGPTKGMINEKDEVEAAILRMGARLTTLDRETAELTGGDWESNVRQQQKEQRVLAQAGLLPVPLPTAGRPPDAPRTPHDRQETEELDDVTEPQQTGRIR